MSPLPAHFSLPRLGIFINVVYLNSYSFKVGVWFFSHWSTKSQATLNPESLVLGSVLVHFHVVTPSFVPCCYSSTECRYEPQSWFWMQWHLHRPDILLPPQPFGTSVLHRTVSAGSLHRRLHLHGGLLNSVLTQSWFPTAPADCPPITLPFIPCFSSFQAATEADVHWESSQPLIFRVSLAPVTLPSFLRWKWRKGKSSGVLNASSQISMS